MLLLSSEKQFYSLNSENSVKQYQQCKQCKRGATSIPDGICFVRL